MENCSQLVFIGSARFPPLPRVAVIRLRPSEVNVSLLLRSEADGRQRRSLAVSSSCSARGRTVSGHGSNVNNKQTINWMTLMDRRNMLV